jgi:hypothetical protein
VRAADAMDAKKSSDTPLWLVDEAAASSQANAPKEKPDSALGDKSN